MECPWQSLLEKEALRKEILDRLRTSLLARHKILRDNVIRDEIRRENIERGTLGDATPEDTRREQMRRYCLTVALEYMEKSNCLDKRLVALLVKDGKIISIGWNSCGPNGVNHGDKIDWCPREDSARGADKTLCRGFHAEEMTCFIIRECGMKPSDYNRFGWHRFETPEESKISRKALRHAFTKKDKKFIRGAELYLYGVHWVCAMPCQWLLQYLKVKIPAITLISQGYKMVLPLE